MDIIVHTMEYFGPEIHSSLSLRNYREDDFETYADAYDQCFSKMRTALNIFPVHCCADRKTLLKNCDKIFIYEKNSEFCGAVTIKQHEIDDLIVPEKKQRQGFGQELLIFALCYLQRQHLSSIQLHVADWNQNALKLYLKTGFQIIHTETIR